MILKDKPKTMSTLVNLDLECVSVTIPHTVWTTVQPTSRDAYAAQIKSKFLIETWLNKRHLVLVMTPVVPAKSAPLD